MTIQLTTPALLFPAISLLLLAYTNRFLVIAQLTRSLHSQYADTEDSLMREQISHLRRRIALIRHMQIWGVVSFILCTLTMIASMLDWHLASVALFAISLVCLLGSLVICLAEIYISGRALNMQLQSLER